MIGSFIRQIVSKQVEEHYNTNKEIKKPQIKGLGYSII